jgi:excinuclease UvrABC helicase subunit UvrB
MDKFFDNNWNDWKNLFNFKYSFIPKLEKVEYDWEQLKKIGKVEETIEDKDGFRTITKTFISNNGKKTITESSTSLIIDNTKKQLEELNIKIQTAVKEENYEKAAQLKKLKEQLLNKN